MAKKFTPPFKVSPPLPDAVLEALGIPTPDLWEVIDRDYVTISTHKTQESAERGLEAANRNLVPRSVGTPQRGDE